MRKALLAFSLAGIICSAVYADGESTYKVIKGDTLSKIAGKMYNDVNQWPKIMEANKNILSNPNAIAVGQVLTIPVLSAAKETVAQPPAQEQPQQQPSRESTDAAAPVPAPEQVAEPVEEPETETEEAEITAPQEAAPAEAVEEPVEEQAEQPAPAPVEEKIEEPEVQAPVEEPAEEEDEEETAKEVQATTEEPFVVPDAESFVAPETWQGDGHIASEKDKKLLISTGDTVYINVGAASVAPGTKCIVYRIIGKVQDQNTRDILGNEVRRIGRLKVMDAVGVSAATAKVMISYDPIQIGDIIKIVSDAR